MLNKYICAYNYANTLQSTITLEQIKSCLAKGHSYCHELLNSCLHAALENRKKKRIKIKNKLKNIFSLSFLMFSYPLPTRCE